MGSGALRIVAAWLALSLAAPGAQAADPIPFKIGISAPVVTILPVWMAETGGFYAKTHLFPGQAMARLENALAGHYVLTFAKPDLRRGEHDIDIALVGRKGRVLARPSYEG